MSRPFLPVATRYPSGESLETMSPTPPHPGKSHTVSAAIVEASDINTLIVV